MEDTHHDQCTTGVLAVEGKRHHVGHMVHFTFTGLVIEVQQGVADVFVLQQTVRQSY